MNFSTNQVIQLYVLEKGATIAPVTNSKYGLQYIITHADGNKTETTDVMKYKVGGDDVAIKLATDDKTALTRKKLTVTAADIVAGQEYIIALTFRGVSQEETRIKVFSAKAKSATAADLYKALAVSAYLQRGVDVEPLYEVIDGAGDAIVGKKTVNGVVTLYTDAALTSEADFSAGFGFEEAKPYWHLQSFPETTAQIEIGTTPVYVSGVEVNDWLVVTDDAANATTLPNTHKIADLEYFAKGERGNSDSLAGWPCNIEPDLYVDADDADGYNVLACHYAFVGSNDEAQKSERDAIFVTPATGGANMASIVTAFNALPEIA